MSQGVVNCSRAFLVLLLLPACAAPPPDPDRVEAAVRSLTATDRSDTPALESELLDLAHQYASAGDRGHAAILLNVGEDALAARLHLIRAARRSIDVQVFLWVEDEAGMLIHEEILASARRGVRVRILLDQFANRNPGTAARWAVAHRNVELRVYNPLEDFGRVPRREVLANAITGFDRLNRRMHNKVMVVDGVAALVGGRNIDNRYFDLDPEWNYLDRDVLVLGPESADAEASFEEYWTDEVTARAQEVPHIGRSLLELEATREPVPEPWRRPESLDWIVERAGRRSIREVLPHSEVHEVSRVEFIADSPMKRRANLNNGEEAAVEDLLDQARESIIFQSNYLIFTNQTMNVLRRLHEERPEVRLQFVTNSLASTGNLMCYGLSRKQRMRMLAYGLRIRELRPVPADVRHFQPRYDVLLALDRDLGEDHRPYEDILIQDVESGPQLCIHAKSLVIDRDIALVGSHNFDPRSQIYNTESSVVIHDDDLARELEHELTLMAHPANSWVVTYKSWIPLWTETNMLLSSLSRLLPVFDVYPWRGYTCYELREGGRIVEDRDPEFLDQFRDVGESPEVPLGWKRFNTALISAFVGPVRSLL